MATEWLPIVISLWEKNYMMLQFGGRNPEFGVNHVYRCLDVYYLVLCVLMCTIFMSWMFLVELFNCYGVNG